MHSSRPAPAIRSDPSSGRGPGRRRRRSTSVGRSLTAASTGAGRDFQSRLFTPLASSPGRTSRWVAEPATTTHGRTLPSRSGWSGIHSVERHPGQDHPADHGSSRSNSSSSSGVSRARRRPDATAAPVPARSGGRPVRRRSVAAVRSFFLACPDLLRGLAFASACLRAPRRRVGFLARRASRCSWCRGRRRASVPSGGGAAPLEGAPSRQTEPVVGVEDGEAQVGRGHARRRRPRPASRRRSRRRSRRPPNRRPRAAGPGWGRRRASPSASMTAARHGSARPRPRTGSAARYWARAEHRLRVAVLAQCGQGVGDRASAIGERGSESACSDSLRGARRPGPGRPAASPRGHHR